jgi:hypothetical protein
LLCRSSPLISAQNPIPWICHHQPRQESLSTTVL